MRSVIFLAALILAACSPGASRGQTGAPVAQGEANTDFAPAFTGQTRAPESVSAVRLNVEMIASGLSHPWALAFLPDGRLLVTERPGRLRVVTREGLVSQPVRGLPDVHARGQGGLLDVALAPDFSQSRMIYWSYAELREDGRNGTAVARGRLSDDTAQVEHVQVIFRQQPAWDSNGHFGSRLVFDREGRLYVALGERQRAEARVLAQDLSTHLGKVVRINADGSTPSDNPFIGRADARPEIWAYGVRNVQGADLHPDTGELWTIEHGPRGGDELNIPRAGRNYGWPIISYGEDYNGQAIGEGIAVREGMEQPIYYWDPVIAPGGMHFYRGALFPWRGDLLIAGLQSQGLVRLELEEERVTGEQRLALGARIRDVAESEDGALWVLTDEGNGRLLRLTPQS